MTLGSWRYYDQEVARGMENYYLGVGEERGREVAKDLKKVKKGTPLSPVLVVRGDLKGHRDLTVADGYHRICASYHLDPDADVPCQIVDLLVD